MKKKLFGAICVFMICVFAILAFAMLSKKSQNKILFLGDKAVIWVLTGSMEEIIPEKSYILIKRVNDAEKEVEVGDIITFYSSDPAISGRLNTHQVIGIDAENKCFITKGVNNKVPDTAEVPYGDVVGEYVRNLTVMTALGRFFTTTPGLVCAIIVLLGLACAIYVPDIIRQAKSARHETREEEIERRIAEEVERLKKENNNRQD